MNAAPPNIRILVAASGTGGHLGPAVEIAKAIRRKEPSAQIEFVGAGRPLEEKFIDAAGFRRHVISIAGIKRRGLRGVFEFFAALPRAWKATSALLTDFKPQLVLGVGGYVSFLPVTLAAWRGIPTWIHEAELRPGMANFFLCWYASKVSTAFAGAKLPNMKNVVYTGHPLRQELKSLQGRHVTDDAPRRLLIMGGSQGAQAIDLTCKELAPFFTERSIEIFHQCRPENVDVVADAYRLAQTRHRVVSFIDDMAAAYSWADVGMSRAGAGTVMEMEAVNLPAIFIPYPYAQGNHQAANANTLVAKGKALVVEEGAHFKSRLQSALEKMFTREFYRQMFLKPCETRSLNAADEIAQGCVELARSSISV
ncbi:MAG: UDP-N-acetylglucosamine--N-acetylmuramyl-(pentapeptide) pyrophosphoryl-undecaprenol N-acetylglucosamine transferase [Deltaproteobacteria bacterium]|nr:UDP-N-acetylglucosamine--N-acetylmuramyl-(pentapeptide) pyrophosphoryl-undecaprenol N-acetylglucosamine transferase [Deltaproteobacteria bacterium]